MDRRHSRPGTEAEDSATRWYSMFGAAPAAKLARIAGLAFVALALLPGVASAYVYWTNTGSGAVGRANLDGSAPSQGLITGASGPNGVAVDSGHVYWANGNAIGRANLDGTGANPSFIPGASNPYGVAVDAGHVYWVNYGLNGTIGRANLDGSGVNQSFITVTGYPWGLAIDARYVYWANYGAGTIGRANLDGSAVNQSFASVGGSPTGIAVDALHIYWSDFFSPVISHTNLDGSGGSAPVVTGATFPASVAVDAGHIYWSNYTTGTIGRANLDGSGVANQSFITGDGTVFGVAVDQPTAQASPASLAFGAPTPVPLGTVSAPKSVTYANNGTGPLVIRGFAFSGSDPNDFFTANDTCHAPVPAGSSCTAQVRFAPGAQGNRSATMTALTNAPSDPTTSLTGTAGPLPQGPSGSDGAVGATGATGAGGSAGAAGRDAKVTCKVRKPKRKVTCRVRLVSSSSSARVRWRLSRDGRTVAHGSVATRNGRASLHLSRLANLRVGRYVLRVGGRRAATFVLG